MHDVNCESQVSLKFFAKLNLTFFVSMFDEFNHEDVGTQLSSVKIVEAFYENTVCDTNGGVNYKAEFLKSLDLPGMPPH